jgi:hypothetical protein
MTCKMVHNARTNNHKPSSCGPPQSPSNSNLSKCHTAAAVVDIPQNALTNVTRFTNISDQASD